MALEVSELVVTFEYLCQTYYVSLSYFVSNERLQFEPDGLPLLVFLLKLAWLPLPTYFRFEVDVVEIEELTPTRTLRLTSECPASPFNYFAENNGAPVVPEKSLM